MVRDSESGESRTASNVSPQFSEICVIVPAYNESGAIVRTVENIFDKMPGCEIVVINDGSTDDTYQRALTTNAQVVNLPNNLGIGGAVQTGFKFAETHGFNYAFQIDGDGQHDPGESVLLIERLIQTGADIVIGSRWLGRGEFNSTTSRRIGMKALEWLVSSKTKERFTDTTSGFRLFNRRAIQQFALHYPTDYPEVETIVIATRMGMKVVEAPVKMLPREHGKSSIRGFRSAYFMIRIFLTISTNTFGVS